MFEPSRAQGAACRGRLLGRLAESLSHIVETVNGHLAFDLDRITALLAGLGRNEPHPPAVFSHYFDLVAAVQAGDADAAEHRLDDLAAIRPIAPGRPVVLDYSRTGISAAELDLIGRHIALDSVDGAGLAETVPGETAARRRQIESALDRLQRFIPGLSAEIEETVSRFILGKGLDNDGDRSFDGASSLEYWGGVLLNAAIPKSDLQVVETIAHEAGHNVLFGLSPSEFFVINPPDELHASPLRRDPRPLDGIFHATFVLSRMHYAVGRLRAAGGLLPGEEAEAKAMLDNSARAFGDALGVLTANARYTDTGRAIVAECAAYMSEGREAA